MEQYIDDFNNQQIINVESTIKKIKDELEETFKTMENNLSKRIENDIRNNVIQNITGSSLYQKDYGKFDENDRKNIDSYKDRYGYFEIRCDEHVGDSIILGYRYEKYIRIDLNIDNFIKTIKLSKDEYIISLKILNITRDDYDNNRYCTKVIKTFDIFVCTNMCNFHLYSLRKEHPNGGIWTMCGGAHKKTNILMNKIMIDIVKDIPCYINHHNYNNPLSTIEDFQRIFETISHNVETYWGNNNFGNYSLNFEERTRELHEKVRDLDIAKNEITSLKEDMRKVNNENECLKKQIEELQMFKKCLEMVKANQNFN
jgi:hypothetical protein